MTPRPTSACALLAVATAFGCGAVDETGYLCLDGTYAVNAAACNDATSSEATDSSGGADVPNAAGASLGDGGIAWTAALRLGDGIGYATWVGLPGAVSEGAEVTLVDEGGRTWTATTQGTTFVAPVEAAAGDTFSLRLDGTEVAVLSTGDGLLADVPMPTIPAPPPSGPLEADASVFGLDGSFAMWVPASGEVALSPDGTAVRVEAIDQETVCVAGYVEGEGLGQRVCTTADVNAQN
jgi:hypothetical protein